MTKVSKMFKGSSIEFGKCISSFIIRIKRSKRKTVLDAKISFSFDTTSSASPRIAFEMKRNTATRCVHIRLYTSAFFSEFSHRLFLSLSICLQHSNHFHPHFQRYAAFFLLPFQLSQQLTQGMRCCVHTLH